MRLKEKRTDLETHRDDPLLDRVDSELRWTFGLLIISGFSVIR